MVNSRNIGVLGASGLIAQELISELVLGGYEVTKFSRSTSNGIDFHSYENLLDYSDLGAVVNLVGGHSKNFHATNLEQVHAIDTLACEWSQKFGRPYVFMSSGAVFGNGHLDAVSVNSPYISERGMNPYTIGKYEAEARHSELRDKGVRVSDMRLFSYAGPTFVRHGKYFLSLALRAAVDKKIFYASGSEFVRDFVGAKELASSICAVLKLQEGIRFNLFSEEPATRIQILELFQQSLGLHFILNPESEFEFYCSEISRILPDYKPRRSLDVIADSVRGYESAD